jgi:hypothetical protein
MYVCIYIYIYIYISYQYAPQIDGLVDVQKNVPAGFGIDIWTCPCISCLLIIKCVGTYITYTIALSLFLFLSPSLSLQVQHMVHEIEEFGVTQVYTSFFSLQAAQIFRQLAHLILTNFVDMQNICADTQQKLNSGDKVICYHCGKAFCKASALLHILIQLAISCL